MRKNSSTILIFGLILLGGLVFAFYNIWVQAASITTTISIAYTKETHQIDTTQPFTEDLLNPNGSSFDISLPADFLSSGEKVELTMYSAAKETVTTDQPLPSGKLGANIFYNISFKKTSDNSTVSSFDKAATLTFSYIDSDISGIDESTLTAYRWNGSEWVALSDSAVDVSLNKITATTQQFSDFALLGDAPSDNGENGINGGVGGGGGGGGYVPPTVPTKVILNGRAYPDSDVHVLSDGKLAKTVKADSKANFKAEIEDITPGVWSFSVWAIDKNKIKSITYTLTFRVTANTITTVSGIFLPPTINIDKNSLNRGEILNIFGQTVPNAQVDVHVLSEETIEKVESDEIGVWLSAFNTQFLEQGSHTSKAQSQITPEEKSGFGQVLTFYIGKAVPLELNPICPGADLNKDGKVNLVDFSVLLYWWGRENAGVDQNMNGIVDLPDFSIMLYYWTG
ncbi:MAG: hypothetical protein IB617_01920 [Candidatus Nealsonbacteria bacterium]|nr:MAG: hypothetical protein IB617_01920 [Candidatus Nealsonbacteria bacterium]